MFKRLALVFVSAFLVFSFSGCGGGGDAGGADDLVMHPGDVVSLAKTASYDRDEMKKILEDMGIESPIVFGIEVFKLIYKTVDKYGNLINASGLLAVPLGTDSPLPLVSDQHGTIFTDKEAPSNNPLNASVILMSAINGFVLAMPDYIGFGASKDKVHPYLIDEPSANAVIDMIKAVRKACRTNGIPLSGKLFLSGYSEGGYVTMAALKKIEEEHPEIEVTAAAPMAGPYDLKRTADFTLIKSFLNYSPFIAYVVYAYDEYYGWNRLDEIINEPFASKLPYLFDGNTPGDEILTQLTNVTAELFRPDFIASYFGNGEYALKEALIKNSVSNWAPKTPMKLIHCKDDPIVPYFNSEEAFDNFVMNGSLNVELVTMEGSDHVECAGPAYMTASSWFASLK